MIPKVYAVIGRGYGDEGKGLATDYVVGLFKSALVVRHNGGAQSGHTVEKQCKDGESRRFVFHELSSGSFERADTFWAKTFYPDLYKLKDEIEEFAKIATIPRIFADASCNITVIDDVLVNMALEKSRGDMRHGSCGMGINEADLRTRAGFGITIEEVCNLSAEQLAKRLHNIRTDYLPKRLGELGIMISEDNEYMNLLSDINVIENFVITIKENLKFVTLVADVDALFQAYETVIFESGQGLLLDADCIESFPHVTASKTGLTNIYKVLSDTTCELNEVIYVSRSYLTRHGAGPLMNECNKEELGNIGIDATNRPNPWQGSLRYAHFTDYDSFFEPVCKDIKDNISDAHKPMPKISLLITHLNETGGKMQFLKTSVSMEDFREVAKKYGVDSFYTSSSPYGM